MQTVDREVSVPIRFSSPLQTGTRITIKTSRRTKQIPNIFLDADVRVMYGIIHTE